MGFNYRMTNLEAALGLAQLERLEGVLAKKKKINQIYKNELANTGGGISFQEESLGAESSFWFSCVVLDEGSKIDNLQKELKKQGIPTRRIFMPVVEFPPYKQDRKEAYQNAYSVYDRGLCLPSSTLNSCDDIYYVCEKLKELIK
jgi:perosamine synthetase